MRHVGSAEALTALMEEPMLDKEKRLGTLCKLACAQWSLQASFHTSRLYSIPLRFAPICIYSTVLE